MTKTFCFKREKLATVSEEASNFKHLFLHGTVSIIAGFIVIVIKLVLSIVGKNASHTTTTMDKQNFCKPVVSKRKVIDI